MPIQSEISEAADTRSTGGESPSLSDLESLIVRQTAAIDVLSGGLQILEQRLLEKLTDLLDRQRATETSEAEVRETVSVASDSQSEHDSCSPATEASADRDVQQSWEAIRQALLSGMDETDPGSDSVAKTESSDSPGGDNDAADEGQTESVAGDPSEQNADVLEIVLPDPVDPDSVEDPLLRDALIARDELIRQLASRLRNVTGPTETLSTEQLREMASECPEELQCRVEKSLERLDEQLRLTEMELSLERARLSRQAVQLETSQALLRHTARQMGLSLEDDGTLQGPSQTDTGGGRKWIRVLGFGGNAD